MLTDRYSDAEEQLILDGQDFLVGLGVSTFLIDDNNLMARSIIDMIEVYN